MQKSKHLHNNRMTIAEIHSVKNHYPALITLLSLCVGNPTNDKLNTIIETYDRNSNYVLYGYCRDKIVMGIIGFDQNTHTIMHLSVLEDHQNKGIGHALLEFIVKQYSDQTINVETDGESVGFYERVGFDCHPFEGPFGLRYRCEKTD